MYTGWHQTVANGRYQIEQLPEFDNHDTVNFIHNGKTGLSGFVAIHRGNVTRPSFGATRLWQYESESDALNDALRLSRMMSYKAALAGLDYGGGKAVLLQQGKIGQQQRKALLKSYAEKINYMDGRFITGTDVGLLQSDVRLMARISPYFVGVKVNPTTYTALGLYYSICASLEEVYKTPEVRNRTFAIQGLGKIGFELLRFLYHEGGNITVAEINPERVKMAKRAFPRIHVVAPKLIHAQKVDVFSPCALSHSLKFKNISKLRCAIIAGGANNQLEHDNVGELLFKLGIAYAPDYVVNAGGLISVVDEYEHKHLDAKRIKKRVEKIQDSLKKIFLKSRQEKKPTNIVANEMARTIFNKK